MLQSALRYKLVRDSLFNFIQCIWNYIYLSYVRTWKKFLGDWFRQWNPVKLTESNSQTRALLLHHQNVCIKRVNFFFSHYLVSEKEKKKNRGRGRWRKRRRRKRRERSCLQKQVKTISRICILNDKYRFHTSLWSAWKHCRT